MFDLFPLSSTALQEWQWAGNSAMRMLAALGIFVALTIFFRFVVPPVLRRMEALAKRSSTKADDAIIAQLQHIPRWVLYTLSVLIALSVLTLPETVQLVLWAGILVILITTGVSLARQIAEAVLLAHAPRLRSEDGSLPSVLSMSIQLVLWVFGILLLLSNLGINVISLVAGLGIGGIAVALAVQNILSDIFSSFALYMDKPFREGDFIVVGPHMGIVKKIGLKTTRIQALQGEEIVISNQELTSTRVQNFKRMHERRIVFSLGVTYDTTPKQLQAIPVIVKGIITGRENARFDRAHFAAFGDSSLNFEIVYYVLNGDYNAYMDLQQEINLAIYEQLSAQNISFAFPTRTVHVVNAQAA